MTLTFRITFHTPFRVASGRAGDGVDTRVDPRALLPASSLKGVMRSAARDLLRLDRDWVRTVFGGDHTPAPWSWSDADPVDRQIRGRARIQIDDATATAAPGALAVAEEVLAHHATFTVTRTGWIPDHADRHERILIAAALAVTAIGGDRRRGLGWVSLAPTDRQIPIGELVASLPTTGATR